MTACPIPFPKEKVPSADALYLPLTQVLEFLSYPFHQKDYFFVNYDQSNNFILEPKIVFFLNLKLLNFKIIVRFQYFIWLNKSFGSKYYK